MIGYILLVSFVIVIALLSYSWMKSYVPRETIQCSDGVSVFIKGVICDDLGEGDYKITLTLKNNERFGVDGYFINGVTSPMP